jgi:hypothetical protein
MMKRPAAVWVFAYAWIQTGSPDFSLRAGLFALLAFPLIS